MDILLIEMEKYGCDVKGALNRFVNNEKMYIKYLVNFPIEKTFSKFIESFEAQDYETAKDEIHTFKGVTGNLGITSLFTCSSKINQLFNDKLYEEAKVYTAMLKIKYDEVCQRINELSR